MNSATPSAGVQNPGVLASLTAARAPWVVLLGVLWAFGLLWDVSGKKTLLKNCEGVFRLRDSFCAQGPGSNSCHAAQASQLVCCAGGLTRQRVL